MPRLSGRSMTLIAAENLSVRIGQTDVLQGVTLAIKPAEIVTILGPNGSGKSTLLRALSGHRAAIVRPHPAAGRPARGLCAATPDD